MHFLRLNLYILSIVHVCFVQLDAPGDEVWVWVSLSANAHIQSSEIIVVNGAPGQRGRIEVVTPSGSDDSYPVTVRGEVLQVRYSEMYHDSIGTAQRLPFRLIRSSQDGAVVPNDDQT